MPGNESPKPVSIPLLNILAISGSLRAASTNSALVAALAQNAPPDCRVSVYDGLGRLPIFNPDDEGERTPPQPAVLIDAVTAADGVIVSCPEYAHGVQGGLKNALDWLVSRDAAVGKPAMLVHASPRSLFARAALIEIMRTMSFALHEEPRNSAARQEAAGGGGYLIAAGKPADDARCPIRLRGVHPLAVNAGPCFRHPRVSATEFRSCSAPG
ncbi:NADPH-dependent FMN reductase [Mesorhizobium sp. M0768]|uniref:NADPH-dependent FMN reductase n=1 Tax=Mesorhizobium sp. M0768 TaxID=2956996 RepID=UPI003334B08D